MKRTLPHLFGCFVGLLLCGQMVAAQTQPKPKSIPAKPLAEQSAPSKATAMSGIDADTADANLPKYPVPSGKWWKQENDLLLQMIGQVSSDGPAAKLAETEYERLNHITTPDAILATRVLTLNNILENTGQHP